MRIRLIAALGIVILAALAVFLHTRAPSSPDLTAVAADAINLLPLSADRTPSPNPFGLREPVINFRDHITKKAFGIYITPDTSPIENDHFSGFHTGVDAEFTDTITDVAVSAIADGTIIVSQWTTGYGGAIVIRHTINDMPVYALYGHLDATSFTHDIGTRVTAGQQIAILGDDHSEETDGVRKHLHFSLSTTDILTMRGYVKTQEELAHWLNPLDFFPR